MSSQLARGIERDSSGRTNANDIDQRGGKKNQCFDRKSEVEEKSDASIIQATS